MSKSGEQPARMMLETLAIVAEGLASIEDIEDGVSRAFSIVPYEPRHLKRLVLQPHQKHLHAELCEQGWAERITGEAWTAFSGSVPIGCGGFHEHWPGRVTAWAILAESAGPHMLAITRAVRREFARHPAERIEAQTLAGFAQGERWARLLGLAPERLLRKFNRGQDFMAFVLLKDG